MAQKKSGGEKNFSPWNQFASYACEFTTSLRLTLMYTSVAKRRPILIKKMHKIWSVDSQENY